MNGMNIFWAVGAVFLACLAWSVMPTLGWRYLVAFSTLPLAIFVIFAPKMVPESPYYLASTGQKEKVKEILHQVRQHNKEISLCSLKTDFLVEKS